MSSRLSSDKGYAKEEGREATGNRLLLFPVLRLRFALVGSLGVFKFSDFVLKGKCTQLKHKRIGHFPFCFSKVPKFWDFLILKQQTYGIGLLMSPFRFPKRTILFEL